MVSDRGLNYALGNLSAGPNQWKQMYATGSTVAFALNIFLAYIGAIPPLLSGSESALSSAIPVFTIEHINAIMLNRGGNKSAIQGGVHLSMSPQGCSYGR